MANRDFHFVQAPETEVKILTGYFVGVNTTVPVVFGGCIESIVRAGEGDWDLVLKEKFPGTGALFEACTVAGAAGDNAQPSAYDPEAGTITISGFTAAGAADDMADKTIKLLLVVRNTTNTRR